jgi:hypothetical protein
MSDESEVQVGEGVSAEPTGAELARDFASQNEAESTPAETVEQSDGTTAEQPESKPEIPTVDDAQEVKEEPIPARFEEYMRQTQAREAQYEQAVQRYSAYIQNLERQVAQYKQPAKPTFDVEAWKKLVETDPVAAIAQAAEMKMAPKFQSLEQKLQQADDFKTEYQQKLFLDRMNNCQQDCERKYPDFKQGSPVYQAAYRYVQQNASWLEQAAKRDPNFNPVELAYRHVSHDFLTQKNKAQSAKLVDKRTKAATVVPSATAPVVPTGVSSARAAAADRAALGDPVPEKWVQAMERAAKRNDLA